MNDMNTMRTDLANQFAAAGAKLLDFTMTAGALAAIPNTAPQQYAVAGTLESIQKVLPAAEPSHPQRRLRHGERPTEPLSFDDEAVRPVEAAGAVQAEWKKLRDNTVMLGGPFDVVLTNGVTLYAQEYNCIDWTQVADWRDAATHPAEPAVPNQPVPGQLYDCTLEHCVTGDVRQALLLCVDEDDCTWRTADDHSELSNGWEVAAWSRAPSPVGGTLVASDEPADDQWIFDLAAEYETSGSGLFGPVTFSAEGLANFVHAAVKRAAPAGALVAKAEPTLTARFHNVWNDALEEAAKGCEQLFAPMGAPDDPHPEAVLINGAIRDCIDTIRELKSSAAPTESAAAPADARTILNFAADVIELFDDATMLGDYMLDAGECADIIRALPVYLATQPIPTKGHGDTDKGEGDA